MLRKLAMFVSVVLGAATLLLPVAISGEASAMPVPGSDSWDTAITGVIEELDEPTPQGDTHAVVQDGNSIPVQSDALDLSDYVGEEVTVYIRTITDEDGNQIFDVNDVGPPEDFSAAKA